MSSSGARLFRQYGCSGCHRPDSTVKAPLLNGVYGHPVPLQDGRFVVADDRYIRDSILLPKTEIVAGFEPIMPSFREPDQRRRTVADHRIYQVAGDCRKDRAMSLTTANEALRAEPRQENYLTAGYTVKSWLLTRDHKRIAILYMVALTFFFFIGGAAATLLRLELMTPAGDVVQPETYNKLFTLHGVVMVFFFLCRRCPACSATSSCRS